MSAGTVGTLDTTAPRAAERAAVVLRVAYAFPVYWILTESLHWREYSIREAPDLLWPVSWMAYTDLTLVGPGVLLVAIVALAACSVWPQFRWVRAIAAGALTEYLALRYSLGKIHHGMHGWLLCLWVLCWLPKHWTSPKVSTGRQQRRLLCTFHTCQVLIATTYTLSGIGKILGSAYQWWRGESTYFAWSSVADHTAARLLETAEWPLLGDWTVRHGVWLWPGAMALLSLQLSAVWLSRRPHCHSALGAGLISFHALTTLMMGIDFTPAVMLCGVLYVASPFTAPPPARPS